MVANVSKIVTFDLVRNAAVAGDAITLVLDRQVDVARGDMLVIGALGTCAAMAIRIDLPGELPEPMSVMAMDDFLNEKEGYQVTAADEQMMTADHGQLVGQFLIDREGIVRWSFTEVLEAGLQTFKAPNSQELMSVASQVVH